VKAAGTSLEILLFFLFLFKQQHTKYFFIKKQKSKQTPSKTLGVFFSMS